MVDLDRLSPRTRQVVEALPGTIEDLAQKIGYSLDNAEIDCYRTMQDLIRRTRRKLEEQGKTISGGSRGGRGKTAYYHLADFPEK